MKKVYQWEYKKRDGKTIGLVARLENYDNSKEIIPHFKNNGQGQFKPGIPQELKESRPLYGLHTVPNGSKTIYIVEGEKCSQALNSAFNLPCVTSLGGANSAKKANWSKIQGLEHYVLIPDKDEAGLQYMQDIYHILKDQNPESTFTLLELPNLNKKEDICDWFKLDSNFSEWNELDPINNIVNISILNGLKSKFLQFVESKQGHIPYSWKIKTGSQGLKCINIDDLLDMKVKPLEKWLDPWITEKSLSMVFAERGIGKTFFSLNCAYALASGKSYLIYNVKKPVSVIYIDGEMQAPLMSERLRAIKGNGSSKVPFELINPDLQGDRGVPDLSSEEGQKELDEMIDKVDAKVIFIDNLSTLCRTGRENEGESWLSIQNWAIKQRSKGRAIVFVHHANKGGEQRGSSRKEDALDNVIRLSRPDDYDESRDGAKFEIRFTKGRSLTEKDKIPIIASLDDAKNGIWSWQKVESREDKCLELYQAGYKQKEIAQMLDISPTTVCRVLKISQDKNK